MTAIESLTRKERTTPMREVTGTLSTGGVSSTVKAEGNSKIFGKENMGKEEFLKLLVTSLQHQDPLDPTSNEDFISQMAQFSALENSTNMVKSMDNLSGGIQTMVDKQDKASTRTAEVAAIGLLGHKVRIKDSTFHFDGKSAQAQVYLKPGEIAVATVSNIKGEVIWEDALTQDGSSTYTWNGQTQGGKQASSGTYTLKIEGGPEGLPHGYSYVEDLVTGVMYQNGETLLQIGNKILPYKEIIQVVEQNAQTGKLKSENYTSLENPKAP